MNILGENMEGGSYFMERDPLLLGWAHKKIVKKTEEPSIKDQYTE